MHNHIEQAHQAGITEARQDIAAGRLRLQYGARGSWATDLAKSLKSQFDAELVVLSCFVADELNSFVAGYNASMEAHIDSIWGEGSLAKVRADVQRRRKEAYDKSVLDRGMETG